jgi:hypothetical protein
MKATSLIFLLFLIATSAKEGLAYEATATELVMLPKYCWAQYIPKLSNRPKFSIGNACGVGMNHYCPSLQGLMRAEKMPHGFRKLDQLKAALNEIKYTLDYIARNGTQKVCFLYKEAKNMENVINRKIADEQRYQMTKIR